ncbi:hypothetical protein EVAR_15928_1 [Eumeta japonica]|uniref:Uncharacterized protein n=1 Tax=Eumeta variegata TaxID=151549 RepID=A0A4C1UL60_EUMVA|nr:hypothetical protein EVAR_15928_1 [Eumeta japonica]
MREKTHFLILEYSRRMRKRDICSSVGFGPPANEKKLKDEATPAPTSRKPLLRKEFGPGLLSSPLQDQGSVESPKVSLQSNGTSDRRTWRHQEEHTRMLLKKQPTTPPTISYSIHKGLDRDPWYTLVQCGSKAIDDCYHVRDRRLEAPFGTRRA